MRGDPVNCRLKWNFTETHRDIIGKTAARIVLTSRVLQSPSEIFSFLLFFFSSPAARIFAKVSSIFALCFFLASSGSIRCANKFPLRFSYDHHFSPNYFTVGGAIWKIVLLFPKRVATSALIVSSPTQQFRAVRRSRRCSLFAFQFERSAVEATEMICVRGTGKERCILRRARKIEDWKLEILIRKTRIVRKGCIEKVRRRRVGGRQRKKKKIDERLE